MAEQTPTHRTLVAAVVSHLANNHGGVTHADGYGILAAPRAIGRHRPDALTRDERSGVLVIGEAKQGDDLFTEHSQEQLHDFSNHTEASGQHALLVLAVPTGWESEAERAVKEAGGLLNSTFVLGVPLPDTPAPPDEP